jgi:hypothetical protein
MELQLFDAPQWSDRFRAIPYLTSRPHFIISNIPLAQFHIYIEISDLRGQYPNLRNFSHPAHDTKASAKNPNKPWNNYYKVRKKVNHSTHRYPMGLVAEKSDHLPSDVLLSNSIVPPLTVSLA